MARCNAYRTNGNRSTTARFCIHCREFRVKGQYVKSPSLAYCVKSRVTGDVDLSAVQAVRCADRQGEGFHSITSLIG